MPGHPVISNCGAPTEKVSKFLDHHLQPVIKEGKLYIKDTTNFLDKLKALDDIPEGTILVTADVVQLYPSIPHTERLEVLCNKFLHKKVPSEDIIKMADFLLKNNFLKFNLKFFQQISGTDIGNKFAPTSTHPPLPPPPPHPNMLVFLWTTLKQNLFGRTVEKT